MGKYATKEQLTALVADMASKINIASGTQGVSGSYVPIGFILPFMGVEAPPDFLVCDGSLHSIASYPQLADHFYEQFGASNHFGGNGTTTFAVPDLRGEFLRGTGTNGHENQGSGANVGEHQDGTVHTRLTSNNAGEDIVVNKSSNNPTMTDADYAYDREIMAITTGGRYESYLDDMGEYTSRPTNTSVLWCIKAIDTKFDPEIQMVKYSTEEQLIGTWIGGEKLYQKTIEFSDTTVAGWNSTGVLASSVNADAIVGFEGIATSGMVFYPLSADIDDGYIKYNMSLAGLSVSGATIRYTKTT